MRVMFSCEKNQRRPWHMLIRECGRPSQVSGRTIYSPRLLKSDGTEQTNRVRNGSWDRWKTGIEKKPSA